MNVLLITFSFPPAGGVGVLRATSLAKYLPSEGVRVDVLTARNAPSVGRDESLLRQIPAGVSVHRTWTLDLPFGVRKRIKALLSRGKAPSAHTHGATSSRPSILGRIKRFVGNLLLPDPQIGWLPFASRAAKRIIRKRKIDAVLITVPPFSSVKLASTLRSAFPHLPIVVDFRDEWLTTTLDLVSFNNNERARRIAQQTESAAVHASTAVVMVTDNAVEEIRKRYPSLPPSRFHCIPNGFDSETIEKQWTQPDDRRKVTLTYIGSVYGSTDPRTFIQALASLPADLKQNLTVRFVGRIETPTYRAALEAEKGTVELVGFVPQVEALRMLQQSHFALLITHDPINVSAKFYDYLGGGIPILGAVHPNGEVRRLLDATRAGRWADVSNPDAIRTMLISAIEDVRRDQFQWDPNRPLIAQYDRRPLAQRYSRLLQSLARPTQ